MENKQEEQPIVGYTLTPLPSCVTEKYMVFGWQNWWGHTTFRVGTNDTKFGTSFGATNGHEIPLAVVRPGKEKVEEALPAGAITVEEFQYCLNMLVTALATAPETYKSAQNKEGF